MGLLIFAVLLLVIILAAVLLLRDRVASYVEVGAVVVFIGFAAVALSAVLAPGIYRSAADVTLDAIGVLGRIQQLDAQLAPLAAVSDMARDGALASGALGQLLESSSLAPILERLGVDAKELLPSEGSSELATPTRIIEDTLYPSLVALLASIFRILALALAVPGMIAVVSLGYAASLVGDARRGRQSLAELEARVAVLEAGQ